MEVPCPSCGAPLTFRTSFSVYAVCGYCGSTVVRRDKDVEKIGEMADLPDEMTPVQVGTTLTYGGAGFTVAGRVRVGWADGAWNEWYLVSDARTGWLAEAQGFFAVSFPVGLEEATGLGEGLSVLDGVVRIRERAYRVTDIKEALCLGSEGELPFAAPKGKATTYYDMLEDGGGFASIEETTGAEAKPVRTLFVGEYVAFNALKFGNLRTVEGWAAPVRP